MTAPGSQPEPPTAPVTASHELGFDLPAPASVSKSRAVLIIVVGALVLGAAFSVG
jgi:hypothetical protein